MLDAPCTQIYKRSRKELREVIGIITLLVQNTIANLFTSEGHSIIHHMGARRDIYITDDCKRQ